MATMDDRVSRANSTASVFINPMTALVSLPDLADSLRATPIATSASDVSPWGLLSRSNSASLIRSSGSLITTFSHSGLLRGSQALRDSDGLVPEAAFLSTATPESRSRNGSWSAVESALILGAPTRQVSHIELVREGRCDVAADPVPVKHLAKNRATRKSESQAMVKQVGLRAQNGGKGKRASEPSFKPPIRLGAETPTRQENGTSRENSVLEAVDNARSRRNSMHQELKSRRQSSKPTIKPASTKTGTKSVQLRRASLLPTDAVIPPSSNTTVDTLARSSRPSNIAAETTITPESDITVPQTSGSTKSPDTFTRDSASFKNPRSSYIIPTQPASSVNKSSTGIVIESRKNSMHLSKSRENSVLVTGDEDSVRQRAISIQSRFSFGRAY
ncbi:hypothetical protein BC830DRAFT_1172747 [Chytriomyces sp. MP71]|nr:hypothetical protein BC830DRAFT_1172747 [Chytriomyces sp. MP71]